MNRNVLVELLSSEYIEIRPMYASPFNMAGTDAYGAVGLGARCFACPCVVENLNRLKPLLKDKGLKLKIFDAYRPPAAHKMLAAKVPVKGLFAETPESSMHCRAAAVDVCLCDLAGKELDFPTAVDAYTPEFARQIAEGITEPYANELKKAGYDYDDPADAEKIKNRTLLRSLMEQAGFSAYPPEWWHFSLPDAETYPVFDFKCDFGTGQFSFIPMK